MGACVGGEGGAGGSIGWPPEKQEHAGRRRFSPSPAAAVASPAGAHRRFVCPPPPLIPPPPFCVTPSRSAKGHLLNAAICQLCSADLGSVRGALERYRDLDINFDNSREAGFVTVRFSCCVRTWLAGWLTGWLRACACAASSVVWTSASEWGRRVWVCVCGMAERRVRLRREEAVLWVRCVVGVLCVVGVGRWQSGRPRTSATLASLPLTPPPPIAHLFARGWVRAGAGGCGRGGGRGGLHRGCC